MTPLAERLRGLRLRTRRLLRGSMEGGYPSLVRGNGLQFDDLRPYTPGDDVRRIDWNVTARAGEPFVRRYTEERDRTLMLALDDAPALDFGTRPAPGVARATKRDRLAEVGAALAWLAADAGDRVGLRAGGVDLVPARGPAQAGRVARLLATPAAGRVVTFAELCRSLLAAPPRRSVVVLLGDFLDASPEAEAAFRLAAGKHDLIAVRATDPGEADPPRTGLTVLSGALVDLSDAATRRAFADAARVRDERFGAWCRAAGAERVEVSTHADPLPALAALFRQRGGRR